MKKKGGNKLAIEKIAIDIRSNSKELAKQLDKIDSKVKQLKIEKNNIQSSVTSLQNSLGQLGGFSFIEDTARSIESGAAALGAANKKIPSDLTSMVPKLASMGIVIVGMEALVFVSGKLSAMGSTTSGFETIDKIGKSLESAAKTMSKIAKNVPSDFGEMGSRLASMGLAIGGMGVLVGISGKLADGKNAKVAQTGFKTINEIINLLGNAGKAMTQIAKKVPSNLKYMATKLASIGIAIGGMSLLVAIVGKFSDSNPLTAIAGLVVVGEVIDLLSKAAEAMKQINKKVPEDVAKVAIKLANIGIAIGGMSVLVGVVGSLVASGIGALIAGAGLATIYLVAEELIHVSEAIKQLDENVSEDTSSVKNKITSVATAIGYFTEANLGSVLDLFKNAVGTLNTAVVAKGISQLVNVGIELEKLKNITVPENIQAKIMEIQSVFGYLTEGVGIFGMVKQFFTGGGIDTNVAKKAAQYTKSLLDTAEQLAQIQKVALDQTLVDSQLQDVQETIKKFETINFEVNLDQNTLQKVVDKITLITDLMTQLETALQFTFDAQALIRFEKTLDYMRQAIDAISKADLTPKDAKGKAIEAETWENSPMANVVQQALDKLTNLNSVGTQLKTALEFEFDLEESIKNFTITLETIQRAINLVLMTNFTPSEEWLEWDEVKEPIESAINKLTALNKMGKQLVKALKFTFDDDDELTKFQGTLEKLKKAIEKVNAFELPKLSEEEGDSDQSQKLEGKTSWDININAIKKRITSITNLSTNINNIPAVNDGELAEKIRLLQNCFSKIRTFLSTEEDLGETEKFTVVIENFSTLAKKLTEEILPQLTSFGTNFANGLMARYQELNPLATIKTTLESYQAAFKVIGDTYTKNLTAELLKAIKSIPIVMQTAIDGLNAMGEQSVSSKFGAAGQTLGKTFVNGFALAIEGLGTTVKS